MLRLAAAMLLLSGIPLLGHAGTLTQSDECRWSFKGAITEADVAKLDEATPTSCGARLQVVINSPGGDVAAAMAIGRLLRAREATVGTCQCESSCVLVYLAGIERYDDCGGQRRLKIGLHRVYWTQLSATLSQNEVQSKRRDLIQRVRSYLEEMNASPQLLPMMEAVPPEKIRYLTDREIEDLGITGQDPVYNERWVAKQAHFIGITSAEYRRRDARAEAQCQSLDWSTRLDCGHAIRWNVSVEQYRRSVELARERCTKLIGDELATCVRTAVRSAAMASAR